MKNKALRDDYGCGFGDGIDHRWTIGEEYEIVLDDEKQVLVSLSSDNGTSTPNFPYKFIDKNLMLEMFGIVLNVNEEQEE